MWRLRIEVRKQSWKSTYSPTLRKFNCYIIWLGSKWGLKLTYFSNFAIYFLLVQLIVKSRLKRRAVKWFFFHTQPFSNRLNLHDDTFYTFYTSFLLRGTGDPIFRTYFIQGLVEFMSTSFSTLPLRCVYSILPTLNQRDFVVAIGTYLNTKLGT